MAAVVVFPPIDLAGVKGVLIDIDDTLYAYEPCHSVAMDRCQSLWALDSARPSNYHPADFPRDYRRCRERVTLELSPQGACRSRLLAFMSLFEQLGVAAPFQVALRYDRHYWDAFLGQMVIAPDALRFLRQAREARIPVVAVSDMLTGVQIEKLARLQVTEYFSALVTSEEVGAEKPSPLMFARGLAKLGVKAQDAIMVGDSLEKDVGGAEALGLRSYQVRSTNEP